MNSIYYSGDIQNTYIDAILKEIYRDRVYDQFLLGRDNLITYDIGGNVGLVTQYLSQFSQKVYTVEPSKQHLECLHKLIDENKLDNVTVIEKALSDKTGKGEFYHNPNTTMFSLRPAVKLDDTETVDTITMEDLLKDIPRVDFMKLDVEGSEFDVLGCASFANAAPKIDAMMIEYHQWTRQNPHQLHDILRSYNFDTFKIPSEATLIGAIKRK